MMTLTATTIENAVKQLNVVRQNNPDVWMFVSINVNGLDYRFKFYNTWVQIAEGPCGRDASCMGLNVTGFKDYLMEFFQR